MIENAPIELLVCYKNIKYYPVSYQMSFENGNPVHMVTLHDLFSNSIITVNLESIERAKK
jgi:hypothetical protein